MSFSFTLNAQADQYELEIGDRLYAFEQARVQQDFEQMLDMTYPPLFTLIPREVLKDQLTMAAKASMASDSRLKAFRLSVASEPLEDSNNIFLSIKLSYNYLQENGQSKKIQRSVLAIRQDADMRWYFLEIGNGQKALFSAIIPDSLL